VSISFRDAESFPRTIQLTQGHTPKHIATARNLAPISIFRRGFRRRSISDSGSRARSPDVPPKKTRQVWAKVRQAPAWLADIRDPAARSAASPEPSARAASKALPAAAQVRPVSA
jgi:hypothetical protein